MLHLLVAGLSYVATKKACDYARAILHVLAAGISPVATEKPLTMQRHYCMCLKQGLVVLPLQKKKR